MIKDLKEFEQLLKLCRAQGVTEITTENGLAVKFGDKPTRSRKDKEPLEERLPRELSDEEMAFYSAVPPIMEPPGENH